jgi:hypothetical protein
MQRRNHTGMKPLMWKWFPHRGQGLKHTRLAATITRANQVRKTPIVNASDRVIRRDAQIDGK